VDAVYVISVKSFKERHTHIREEMRMAGLKFEFIFDFDADEIETSHPALSREHLSLIQKHRLAWQRVCDDNLDSALVFEDDVILAPGFAKKLESITANSKSLTPGWLIFLGGADHKVGRDFFTSDSPLIEYPNSTAEAYLTDRTACRLRLQWLEHNSIDLPADHLMRQIDQETGVKQYWPPKALVIQGSVTGRFSTTLDRSRSKRSRFTNWARFQWNRFQRRTARKWIAKAATFLLLAPF
jgi:glycosyl transferase family 25